MSLQHILLAVGGAAVAGVAAGLAKNGTLHKAAVKVAAGAMMASDAINAETQAIMDDANDVLAEQRRQAKIDAAVKAELEAMEADVRKKVTAKIDKEGAGK
jgi:hypothetical protein